LASNKYVVTFFSVGVLTPMSVLVNVRLFGVSRLGRVSAATSLGGGIASILATSLNGKLLTTGTILWF
jgi:hypothetical protein